jgi:hypothetical protein
MFFRHFLFACGLLIVLGLLLGPGMAGAQITDKTNKFETYRAAIKKDFGIDIKDFKDQLKGGKSDGKDITKYDHLEKIPDYYTRLQDMEEEAEEEMEEAQLKGKK